MVSVNEFPIATANEIPGFKIIETKGFVYGSTVRRRGVGGQVGLRPLVGGEIKEYVSMMEDSRDEALERFGGEIKEYVSMMEDSRDEALERLIEHAKQLGGNAIVAVRFDSNDISNVMQEILAYGTAVVVEKEE
ncbi:MAG: heavy metal-binding domain-containing protein [Methanobrevibacter smithii]|nr:heavy metal-binding domain-containing protein [Methanobrevibacter smithii]